MQWDDDDERAHGSKGEITRSAVVIIPPLPRSTAVLCCLPDENVLGGTRFLMKTEFSALSPPSLRSSPVTAHD